MYCITFTGASEVHKKGNLEIASEVYKKVKLSSPFKATK